MKNIWLVKEKSKYNNVLPGMLLAFFIGFIIFGAGSVWKYDIEEEQVLLEEGIEKNAKLCYALEGMYPPDIEYLEENYNLEYDHDKYIIHYELFASNISPEIKVFHITKPSK